MSPSIVNALKETYAAEPAGDSAISRFTGIPIFTDCALDPGEAIILSGTQPYELHRGEPHTCGETCSRYRLEESA